MEGGENHEPPRFVFVFVFIMDPLAAATLPGVYYGSPLAKAAATLDGVRQNESSYTILKHYNTFNTEFTTQ